MMFPSAVNGQMPFVDKYKHEQIKKVIDKHRARHHSGPDSRSSKDNSAKHKDTHSMPILWQSVYAGQRPRFLSMPALEDNRLGSHSSSLSSGHTFNRRYHTPSDINKSHKHSLLSSLKKFFFHKKDGNSSHDSSGAIVHGDHSRSYSSASKNRKTIDSDTVVMGGGRSPKRQRVRTISNMSGVMETIEEEVNEVLASTDQLSDSDSCSSCSDLTPHSMTSAPELNSTNNLLYSCSNLSSLSDSSSSRHGSCPDVICAA